MSALLICGSTAHRHVLVAKQAPADGDCNSMGQSAAALCGLSFLGGLEGGVENNLEPIRQRIEAECSEYAYDARLCGMLAAEFVKGASEGSGNLCAELKDLVKTHW